MTSYRILYLAEERIEAFRQHAPRTPPYRLRRSHYEEGPEIAAESPYQLWHQFREQDASGSADGPKPIDVGDALQTEAGLLLCNYWGFDQAEWWDASGAEQDDELHPDEPGHGPDPPPGAK